MSSIHLYFQVHQPYRLYEYTFFDIGTSSAYFNEALNKEIIDKVSDKCYLPTNQLLLDLISKYGNRFACTFSFSGVVLEQLQALRPEVIESFQKLVNTGCVEVLAETYHHSLASLYDKEEFKAQVGLHHALINKLFGVSPTIFRNTELILHPELVKLCEELGYQGVLAEGTLALLGAQKKGQWLGVKNHSPKLLCRDFDLSDEIAYRFSDQNHSLYPLTAPKFIKLLDETKSNINLFMDYETFGEHHWANTQIFDFLKTFVDQVFREGQHGFKKVSDTLKDSNVFPEIEIKGLSSWADTEKDLSAWSGNAMQKDALRIIYELKEAVINKGDTAMLNLWRNLQTSDHFYYMSTKGYTDGEVHNYFSPYRSAYDAYLYYTNVLKDLRMRL